MTEPTAEPIAETITDKDVLKKAKNAELHNHPVDSECGPGCPRYDFDQRYGTTAVEDEKKKLGKREVAAAAAEATASLTGMSLEDAVAEEHDLLSEADDHTNVGNTEDL
jgi:hypothetical protein